MAMVSAAGTDTTATPPPPTTTVKKEKVDQNEIDVLAAEMAEKNRQKMLSQASQIAQQNQASQQALQRAGGQQMITYYFNRDKEKNGDVIDDSIVPKKAEERKKGVIDEDSQRGRFGWTTLHTVHIPFLFRREEKYCAVRMVEMKLLNKYLSFLPQEITTCINVRSYFISDHEARLLNEINTKHCEYQFGRDYFTTKDLVVQVSEAKYFHKFLDTCFKKLVQRSTEQSEFCGFVRINGESVVPYTVKERVKYVPLFYFEGETDTLKLKAEKIDNWELAYLKFCCKVQGIRNELFASDTCAVVSLDDVKQYFPKDTQFEDWWPQKTAEPMRVVTHGSTKVLGSWTQRPATQPPPPSTSLPQVVQHQTTAKSALVNQQTQRHQSMNQHVSKNTSSAAVPNLSQLGGLGNLMNTSSRSNNSAAGSHHQIGSTTITNAGLGALPTSTGAASNYNLSMSNINQVTNLYSQWANMVSGMNGINGLNGMSNPMAAAAAAAYVSNPSMQSLIATLSSDQMRRLGGSVPSVSPHANLTAAAVAAAAAQQQQQQQQHAAATAAQRTLRSHTTSTTQANRHTTTISSSTKQQQAAQHAQQQQQLVNNLNQLNYGGYLSQQTALDNLLVSQSRAYPSQPPVAHANSSSVGLHGSHISNNSKSSNSNGGVAKAPPPLIPVSNNHHHHHSSNGGGAVGLSSAHKAIMGSRGGSSGVDKHKLQDVPPFRPDHSRRELPYIVRKMVVGTRQVFCINHTAYNFGTTSMVALQDLINEFFPTATLASCIEVFTSVLSITVYKANWHQVYALMEAWGTEATPDVVPLIFSEDLVRSLTQMKYIFQRNPSGLTNQSSGQPSHKRIRTS